MKAEKVTVIITIEALSIDVAPSLLQKVIEEISAEYENGEVVANDGDTVKWGTKRKPVEF
jgi:tRNA U34 2-thiouridine synthase MnmA/TrmU